MIINHDAEQSALGCILTNPDCAADVLTAAGPQMYGVPKHADLAAVLADMLTADDPIDPQTVLARLIALSLADKIGGGAYLMTLMERAWSPSHATAYAGQVRDAYRHRRAA
ncbi:MAG TPA: DnaB-like helicase N-terminal domain-containing protein, partial [Mycobacteriales bacterium]